VHVPRLAALLFSALLITTGVDTASAGLVPRPRAVWNTAFPDTIPERPRAAASGPRERPAFISPDPRLDAITACVDWDTLVEGKSLFRVGATAIYDPVRDRMIRFGGVGYTNRRQDVWVHALAGPPGWSRLVTQGEPPPRTSQEPAVYDPIRDRLVVVSPGTDQVYALSLSGTPTWSRVPTTGAPLIRESTAAAYDPVRDRVIVYGGAYVIVDDEGYAENYNVPDTWALSLSSSTWTRLPDGHEHQGGMMYYDSADDRMLVLSEYSSWGIHSLSLSGAPTWSVISPTTTPAPVRSGFATAYDPSRHRVVLFGGWEAGGFLNDVWELDLDGAPAWSSIAVSNAPEGRSDMCGIYDPVRDRMIIQGGVGQIPFVGTKPFSETWEVSFAGTPTWSLIPDPELTPRPRDAHAAILDETRQRMIVFAGQGWERLENDLHVLPLTGPAEWSVLEPTGPKPPGRAEPATILDPVRDRIIVFGGRGGSNAFLFNDTWSFPLSGPPVWTELTPAGSPPSKRSAHSAIYDPVRDRMIVFAGYDDTETHLNDTWALDLAGGGTWQPLTPSGTPPPPLVAHCAIYDPVRDRMIVLTGFDHFTGRLNTVWALDLAGGGSWSQIVPLGDPPPVTAHASAVYDAAGDRILLFGGATLSADVHVLALAGTPTWSTQSAIEPHVSRVGHSAIFDPTTERMIVFGGADWDLSLYLNDVLTMSTASSAEQLSIDVQPAGAGEVTIDPRGVCHATGSAVQLTATPATGYAFSNWSGDVSGSSNPLTITMDSGKHIVAHFIGYPLTLTAAPAEGGTLTRSPDQPAYAPGSQVTITATPNIGYGFIGWTGDTSGDSNPLVVTMNGPQTIVAQFAGYPVTVTLDPPSAGVVVRTPDQPAFVPGAQVTLDARPHPGHDFIEWSGDVSGPVNPLQLTVDQAFTLEANFAAIPPTCGGAWTQEPVQDGMPARRGAATAWDPVRKRLVMFGGYGNGVYRNDVWMYTPETATWSAWEINGSLPGARAFANLVYDPLRDRFLMFGGKNGGHIYGDLYVLDLTSAPLWTQLPITGFAPVQRWFASAVFDTEADRIVLFGGLPLYAEPQPLWELRFPDGIATWNPIPAANMLPMRWGQTAIYDAPRDRMIVFGGAGQSQDFGDVWSLSLTGAPAWQQLHPLGPIPPHVTGGFSSYDVGRERMVVWGGSNSTRLLDEMWALSLAHEPAWVRLSPFFGAPPSPRAAAAGAYDPDRDELMMFGGTGPPGDSDYRDMWRLSIGEGHALDLAVETPSEGGVTRSPHQGCYAPDEIVTLTAVPASGFRFAGWDGDASGNTNPLPLVMDRYRMVIARFDPIATATLLAFFEAKPTDLGTLLRWQFGSAQSIEHVELQRGSAAAGPWTTLSLEARVRADATEALDASAEPGVEYFYRLSVIWENGSRAIFGPISSLSEARPTRSELTLLAPNPTPGDTRMEFALARPGPVRIQVVDIAGRVRSTLMDGVMRPGRFSLRWDGRAGTTGPVVAPGVYFVRFVSVDRTIHRRLVVMR